MVLLAQNLHRFNARLHRLRQPISQVSRLLTSRIVQMKTCDYALHKLIVTDKYYNDNAMDLIAARAAND
jgi:hypothetical protein